MISFAKLTALVGLAASLVAGQTCFQGADEIGRTAPYALASNGSVPLRTVISRDAASYVSLHFDSLNLPNGAVLTLSSPDGSTSVKYTGGDRDNFYAEYIPGGSVVLSYTPPREDIALLDGVDAFRIDSLAYGVPPRPTEAICGTDDTKAAVCVKSSLPTQYTKAQAVGRLLIGGTSLCTGWLFGSEGHLITNNHCIGDANAAKDIQFEFGAECATCADPNNTQQLACRGTIVATSATFIRTNKNLDYTLVKLNLKSGVSLAKYGFLKARASGPKLGEKIYIPQHPAGKPRRIGYLLDNGAQGTIESLNINSCVANEVGYMVDTEGGSSGSPVISPNDHAVIALHNCGGCLNGGVKISDVVNDLQAAGKLPAQSTV
ncbi:hypothetical protein SDRG_06052 [Saprolegnia diclina VS20]|uniref:Serine protease n=1 Tax=Saprolegnia diclina (strain VS20) TaxID=1156394 RepID=T0S1P9_SAPDV|nr:hypothetical protein SDRG_06052 [Saprolegnia diclina VS20]EQC36612.1 hypothetical protein SDRG_06052 [Saprolegnia diclina VS20]|eukprot:XP_008610033.1 hypothetical protein SDRG_06052 [Saprolegnia diclina VS20]